MSGFDLNDFTGPWWGIIQRHRKGERIDKAELVDAIAYSIQNDSPVPDAAKPLAIAITRGEHRFKTNKVDRRFDWRFHRDVAKGMVDHLEQLISGDADISDYKPVVRDARDEYKAGRKPGARGESSRELAKEIVARMYKISVRKLEGIISQN